MPRARIRPVEVRFDVRDLHNFTRLLDRLLFEAEQEVEAAEPDSREQLDLENRRRLLHQLHGALDNALLRLAIDASKRTGGGQ